MPQDTGQRINGSALESIMQDVLQGVQEFTGETCIGGDTGSMEIIAVENPQDMSNRTAEIIQFPRPGKD